MEGLHPQLCEESLPPSDTSADGGRVLSQSERASFEASYRQHRGTVMRLLRSRVNNQEDVADLTQEAYLRILRYRQCGPDSLKYLLIRTALNLAASHGLHARSCRAHVPLDGIDIASDAPSLDEALEDAQRWQRMMAAMHTLPIRSREIFLLWLIHGLRQREIAQRCGISTRRVEQHLARVRMLLREQFGKLAT